MSISINLDEKFDSFKEELIKVIQSSNLNFLFGAGCSNPAVKLLGNIEKTLQDLIVEGKTEEYYLEAAAFLLPIARIHEQLIADKLDAPTSETCENYKKFIIGALNLIEKRKSAILPKRANVFTTNYDLFFEYAFQKNNTYCRLNDGFSRSPNISGIYNLIPSSYSRSEYTTSHLYEYSSEIPTINLFKVHGSLNWEKSGNSVVHRYVNLKLISDKCDLGRWESCKEYIDNFHLILPNKEKFRDTIINQAYYDLLRMYANELDKTNTVLIADGFSFADEHILEITKRALRNPTLLLYVFCYDSNAKETMDSIFSEFQNVRLPYSKKEKFAFLDFGTVIDSLISVSA